MSIEFSSEALEMFEHDEQVLRQLRESTDPSLMLITCLSAMQAITPALSNLSSMLRPGLVEMFGLEFKPDAELFAIAGRRLGSVAEMYQVTADWLKIKAESIDLGE